MQDLMYAPIMDEFGNYDRTMRDGDIVRHFKGNLYQIVGRVKNTEKEEYFMCYRALYGNQLLYIRPWKMFFSKVDKTKYPDASKVYRFEKIEFY